MIVVDDNVEQVFLEAHIPQAEADFEESLKPLKLEAPRILPGELAEQIADVEWVEHTTCNGRLVRWCVLVLRSGAVITGEPNIVFSPENDRPTFGRELAYEKAFAKMWEPEAYHRMAMAQKAREVQASQLVSNEALLDAVTAVKAWTPEQVHPN